MYIYWLILFYRLWCIFCYIYNLILKQFSQSLHELLFSNEQIRACLKKKYFGFDGPVISSNDDFFINCRGKSFGHQVKNWLSRFGVDPNPDNPY